MSAPTYRVIALSLGGLKNKVFKKGDIVTQAQLGTNCAALASQSFLEPVEASKPIAVKPVAAAAVKPVAASPAPVAEPTLLEAAAEAADADEEALPVYDDISVAEIKATLTKLGVAFKSKDTKKKLYAKLEKAS